ncbi:MAG TPA: hypothetical protein GXZ26_05680 [Firmicutes bacterium]|jgi:autoinducer 2 (AI-2) kinase|nr:hypothetical protein [Bacillota bacterium]
MDGSCFLVFDFGTGSGKVVLLDDTGNIHAQAAREWSYTDTSAGGGGLEFSPEDFWEKFCASVREVVTQDKAGAKRICALTATSQREGVVLVDENGQVLYAGPNLDERGKDYNQRLAELYGDKIYRKTGHWPGPIFLPGRISWFKDNRPELYKRIHKVLLLNDWILYKLTGEKFSEPTNACETLLYNITEKSWDQELLTMTGLPAEFFCPVKENGSLHGYLKEELAREWGLPPGLPVIVGAADTQAALLGCGLLKPGTIGVVAGSTCPVALVTDRCIIDRDVRTWTDPYFDGKYVLEANAGPTGLLKNWLARSFYPGLSLKEAFVAMEDEAARIPPGSRGVKAYLGPVISNVKNNRFENERYLTGLAEETFTADGRALLARSVLENIAFAINGNINLLQGISGMTRACARSEKIVVTGGNIHNRLFLQILASLLENPLYVTTPEATALGAAVCAAAGIGRYRNLTEACEKMGGNLERIKGESSWKTVYTEIFREWGSRFA